MLELGEPSVSLSNIPTDSQGKDTRDCQGRDKIIWRKNIRYYLGPGVVIQACLSTLEAEAKRWLQVQGQPRLQFKPDIKTEINKTLCKQVSRLGVEEGGMLGRLVLERGLDASM